jgi:phosphodiesterase/alkaline phosphatase D-like protein
MKKIFTLFVIAAACLSGQDSPHLTTNAVVGGVTSSSARLRVSTSAAADITIEYSTSESLIGAIKTLPVSTRSDEDNSVIIELNDLNHSTTYYYRIFVNEIADTVCRSFATFPAPGSAGYFSFAFGSCQQSGAASRGDVFKEIVRYKPALFLQLGDWTYPDTTDNLPLNKDYYSNDYQLVLQSYRAKFRIDYGMDTLLRSAPVSYVYDDHDYTNNNSSALTASYGVPFKNTITGDFILEEIEVPVYSRLNMIKSFINNMPDYPVENPSRGIYRKFVYGNSEFYMLDLRAQRTPNYNSLVKNSSNGKWEFIKPQNHTILGNSNSLGEGEDQFTWLKRNLLNSSAKWKFLVSSVTFNRAQIKGMELGIELQDTLLKLPGMDLSVYGIVVPMELSDKWIGFTDDMDSLLSFISKNNIQNIFVLSGDSHTSAMDDGTNAGLPEIMSGNLDIGNSRSASVFEFLGIRIWNKGGQGISTNIFNNAFGYVEVYGNDSVMFRLIDEDGEIFSTMTAYDQGIIGGSVSDFSANLNSGLVKLEWNFSGSGIRDYEIQKSKDGIIYKAAGKVSNSGSSYIYPDAYEEEYNYYRLRINAVNGSYKFSEAVIVKEEIIPSFYLVQNYPNPFNISTRIRFSIAEDLPVKITLYNMLGESAGVIVDEFRNKGEHEVEFAASHLASGVYFYRINSGHYSEIKKMILLK